jgi:cell wall assembly regulator SMI1
MRFTNSDPSITVKDIVEIEAMLGSSLPSAVRNLYLSTNGGSPEPYVFENQEIDTVVAELLPLKSSRRGTAPKSYQRLVLERRVFPPNFFPFAIDGGGDHFLVDLRTPSGQVYFYRSDSAKGGQLLALNLEFTQFWSALKEE